MSRRSEKARAKGEARKRAEVGETPKPVRGLRRWRVTIACTIVLVAMAIIGIVNSFRDPRLTLRNQTGGTLAEIKVEYPGVSLTAEPVDDKKSVTFALHPAPGAPLPPPGSMVRIGLMSGGGLPVRLGVRYGERGSHEIYTAIADPRGAIQIVQNNAQGGPAIDFKAWLRRIGINL